MGVFKISEYGHINEEIIIKMGVLLMSKISMEVLTIGHHLTNAGSDDLTDGGFWLYDHRNLQMYYSPKFQTSLGEDLAPNYASFARRANIEDLSRGHKMINALIAAKSESFFVNNVRYTRESGYQFEVICTGAVFYLFGQPRIVLGTHKIVN